MNVRLDGEIVVSLSGRNLKDLVRQVEEGGNSFVDDEHGVKAQLVRSCEQPNGTYLFLRVIVETDEAHYGDRIPGPGVYGGR